MIPTESYFYLKFTLNVSISKDIARKIVFPFVTGLGLEKLLSAGVKSNKLILVYHGVVEKPDHNVSVGPIAVEQFARHLAYFKQNFDVVSQDEIFEMNRNGIVPKRKTIAITFDDGYENNYRRAFPLLKQYGFPSTMYIITQAIEDDNRITWYDYIDFVKSDIDVSKIDTGLINEAALTTISELKALIKRINISARQIVYTEIAKQVDIEKYKAHFPREFWKLMNKEQLRELANSGLVELGAHSHNHPNLGEIALSDAKEEIEKSKRLLEEVIQKPVNSIAFPDGSYTPQVKQLCLAAGYKNLLAVDYRSGDDADDKNILPRYCLSSTTTFESNMIAVHRNFKAYGF